MQTTKTGLPVEVATPWARMGASWARTLRRPLLDGECYPSGGRWAWSVMCPLTLQHLDGGACDTCQEARAAVDASLGARAC